MTAGEYKRTMTMLGENTEKGRAKFQEELEETHQLFKSFVRDNRRGLDLDKVATGEHWFGTQAKELGLVDEIMTSDELLQLRQGSHSLYQVQWEAKRKLGELRLIQDVEAFIRAKELGPDALDDEFDFAAFRERLSGRRGMIKTRLMDQQIIAGIGNVYADEILFQARVHPKAHVDELDEEALRAVFDKMKAVLKTAIDHDAEPSQFPDDFIIPQRHEDGGCPVCGGSVERIKISGRSAYFCPRCQEKP